MNAPSLPRPIEPPAADDPRTIGRYRVLGRLGAGGMGEVFLGLSPGRRLVAVKVVHPHLARNPEFRRRFAREVAAARAVGGFHTPAVVDADVSGPLPWSASEYIAAPALDQVVATYGPLPVDSLWELARGMAEALRAIHAARVVHRDLKPSNVLVAADGPRVIDFGIAQSLGEDESTLTVTGGVIGTPGYMSPEQARGGFVGPAGDVFSLGSVLMFAACGRGPFGNGDPAALLMRVARGEPDLSGLPPGSLGDLVAQCLSVDPAARPHPADLLAVLNRTTRTRADRWLPVDVTEGTRVFTREIADLTVRAETTRPELAPRRRNAVLLTLAVLAIVMLVVAGGLTYMAVHGAEKTSATASSVVSTTSTPRPARISVGGVPTSVALSADGTRLFVLDPGGVQVVDTATNAVVRTVKLDLAMFEEAVVSPDGSRIYAPSIARKVIRILDGATGNEIGTLGPIDSPKRPDVSPDGRQVYVPDGDNLSIFDANTKSRVGDRIPIDHQPGEIRPLPGSGNLIIAEYSLMNQKKNDISVYHPATGAVTKIDVGVRTRDLAVSADGRRAAVTTWTANSAFFIDTATESVTGSIDLGSRLSGIALSADGSRAYIAAEDTATLMVVDTATAKVVDRIRVEQEPAGLAMSTDGCLYVANSRSGSVSVVSTR
ncbi:serine/threonine-protein kinase [Nocardia terrae]|uniref:serine/threonine-protein kinase n=1 Tax=Nocardia terrae TaxID=2675851 RepID=UPI0018DFD092|nr:serine/threonine-protein kinase [Nocardia terrae]